MLVGRAQVIRAVMVAEDISQVTRRGIYKVRGLRQWVEVVMQRDAPQRRRQREGEEAR